MTLNRTVRKLESAMMSMPMMLTCREFDSFITDYFDGNLSRYTSFKFTLHVYMCRPCKDYLKAYQQTIELGKGAFADSDDELPPEVPKELVDLVVKTMKDQK